MCEQSLSQASVAGWEVNNKGKNLAEQNGLCRRIGSLARRKVSKQNVLKDNLDYGSTGCGVFKRGVQK